MSLFITLEGIEGCGKTTQLGLLDERLRAAGHAVVATREPGGCPIADAIRAILLDADNRTMSPRTELLLYAAARAQHVDEVITPALQSGKLVLCDRFADATLAYQGYGRGLDRSLIARLNRLAAPGLAPDLTLLLDFPAEEGVKRARGRNEASTGGSEDRFEQESLEFHRRVSRGYHKLAAAEERFRSIDARGTVTEVASRIARVVDDFLSTKAAP